MFDCRSSLWSTLLGRHAIKQPRKEGLTSAMMTLASEVLEWRSVELHAVPVVFVLYSMSGPPSPGGHFVCLLHVRMAIGILPIKFPVIASPHCSIYLYAAYLGTFLYY